MSTFKIKKGDTVKVIAGKDKDKEGKVISVDRKNNKVVVEGINMVTKHEKPSAANQNGGIVQKEAAPQSLPYPSDMRLPYHIQNSDSPVLWWHLPSFPDSF